MERQKIESVALQKRLAEASREIEQASNPWEINRIVEALIVELIGSEFASLWIFDEKEGKLIRERGDDSLNEISILEQQGIIARSFLTMSGGIYNYLPSEKEYVARFDNPDNIRIKSKIIVPLMDKERFLGLATAYASVRRIRNFDEEDLALLEALAPFLTEAAYRIRPDLREETVTRVQINASMQERMSKVSEKVDRLVEESRRAEEGTKEPSEELMAFLANTVHDIRTPANSLNGFLELLEERIEDARILQFIRNARESAEFINELTTSILDKIALQHSQSWEPITVNPIKFFSDVAAVFSSTMYDKRIAYNIFLDPGLPAEIRIDAFRLKRVVMNLLGNAQKFTPKGKSIELSVEYDSSARKIRVSVRDTGIGIAKEKQEKIFEAFAQAEETTRIEYGGTGLGLSISAQYVAELGGRLQLQSELDRGSRFFFEIPVEVAVESPRFPPLSEEPRRIDILMQNRHAPMARNLLKHLLRLGVAKEKIRVIADLEKLDGDATHLVAFGSMLTEEQLERLKRRGMALLIVEEELFALSGRPEFANVPVVSAYTTYLPELYEMLSQSPQGKSPSRKVLVVDDNRINIELLRTILEEELYHVETATTGRDALELLSGALKRGDPFRLAFVDRHLPDLGGPELVKTYRSLEEQKSPRGKLHAVSITGDPREHETERSYFDAVMRKPFNTKDVKAILTNLKEE